MLRSMADNGSTSPVVARFSRVLTKEIEARGLSQRQAATELGMSSRTLDRYVSGERSPGLEELAAILRAWPRMRARLNYVLTGKGGT